MWHRFMDYRGAARRATKIIAVSESTKRDLVELYGLPENRVQVIYPGVALTHPASVSSLQSPNYFLYFGTFEPRKNIEAVISAYQEYYAKSGIKKSLVIAGSAGWKTRIKLPKNLDQKITVTQNVSEKEKMSLYKNAFAFVFPSFYEGFGFPVLEAAVLGIPVVTSYNSSLFEVAKNFAIFSNPFRPAQISGAMLELEGSTVLYKDLQSKGLQAAKNFLWESAAIKTLNLFQQVTINSVIPAPFGLELMAERQAG